MNAMRNICSHCPKKQHPCLMLGNTVGEYLLKHIQCNIFFLNSFSCVCTYMCRKSSVVQACLEV